MMAIINKQTIMFSFSLLFSVLLVDNNIRVDAFSFPYQIHHGRRLTTTTTTTASQPYRQPIDYWKNLKTNDVKTTTTTTTTIRSPYHNHHHHQLYTSSSSIPDFVSSTTGNILNNVLKGNLHTDSRFVWTALLWLSTFGISLERRTVIGKALSAPLATMALALTVANIGLLPFSSPVYLTINQFLVPLSVSMLLFDSDLKRVIRDTGTLLLAFIVGAIATIIGTIIAFPILPLKSLGPDVGWRIACALAGRHIGGAINFVAVAETLNIGGSAVSAAIAADNVVVALYFAFLFSISKAGDEEDDEQQQQEEGVKGSTTTITEVEDTTTTTTNTISELAVEQQKDGSSSSITLPTLAITISVASTMVLFGRILTKFILPTGTSSLPLISFLTVCFATIFPKFFSNLSETGTALGITCIQLFFAASGAAGSIRLVMEQAPSLFAFSALQIGIHFVTLKVLGRTFLRLPNRELYLASNANVGGPTTAAAMAQAKEWKRLVLPALLIGILGYATATAIALALGPILLRLPLLR